MMRGVKIAAIVLGSIAALALIAVISALIVVRTGWFHNFAREEIISNVEESTGGKVDLQSFTLDSSSMTATVTGFVLHGTEPPGSAPLFEAQRIVLAVKLIAALRRPFVLEYLSVDHPSANVIAFPDGRTNIPEPPKKSTSNKSGLETIVNLAIRRVEINHGSVHFLEQSMPLDVRGNNLRITLAYNPVSMHYQGDLSIEPLLANSSGRPPLEAKIDVPLNLGADAIQITGARITTPQSVINANVSIQHMAAPLVSAQVVSHIGLDELARSLDLPIHPKPGLDTIEATVSLATTDQLIQIQNAVLTLGRSRVTAFGDLRKGAAVNASVVLDELATLLDIPERPSGVVEIAGTAQVPLALSGNLVSHNLSYQQFRDVKVTSGFRVDPNTIAVTGFTVSVLGGELQADARLENASRFTATGNLRNFTIQNITAALMDKPLGYAGAIAGTVRASGALKGPIDARAQLKISPSGRGVPVSGDLDAAYNSAQNLVSLNQSRISLPNTRIDLRGVIGQSAEIRVESRSLEDFSPIVNVGSTVRLKGGVGTVTIHEVGTLDSPQLAGHVQLTNFTLEDRRFDQLSADVRASPSNASVDNGLLKHNGSKAQFSGSLGMNHWKIPDNAPLSAKLTANNTDIADILAIAGTKARITGPLNADVAIAGTIGNPQGTAQITAGPGTAYDEPYDRVQLTAKLSDQRVDLQTLEAHAGAAVLQARGSFTHPRDSLTTGRIQLHAGTNQIQLSQFKTLDKRRPGISGEVSLDSDVLGELRNREFVPSAVNAKLTAINLHDKALIYGNLTATATTYGSDLNSRIDSDLFGSRIQVTARTQLTNEYPTVADATIRSLQIEKTGITQTTGTLSAQAHFTGTIDNPHADASFDLASGSLFNEPITRIEGKASYANQVVTLSQLNVVSLAGSVEARGTYSRDGKIEAHINAPRVQLERVNNIAQRKFGLSGVARLIADVAGELRGSKFLPTRADIKGGLENLGFNQHPLGGLNFEAHTTSGALEMKLDSDLAGSQIHGTGQAQLHGDYSGSAKLTIANLRYSQLEPMLDLNLPLDGLLEAQADFSGPFEHPADGSGNLQISKLEFSSTKNSVAIRNDGPMIVHLDRSEVTITDAKMRGPSTNIELGGKIALNQTNPLDLKFDAHADLGVLKNFIPEAYSEGSVSANATARGRFSRPQLNGRIDLKNAAIQMADWPAGISNANGSILLNGTNARIASLTAETGGGKLTIDGSAAYVNRGLDFNLRVDGQNVRARYAGASLTANAALTLSGSSQQGLLAGNVTVTRVAYNSSSDFGAILTGLTTPPSGPAAPNLLSRIRLNIHVQTAPSIRFQTNLAEQLSATTNLNVLGNLQTPGMVGRINITAGTLIFFGNKYTVNRGSVSFYSGTTIQPVLDVDLQTAAQGVTVNLSVSGPLENMKLSYRSDPPLKFEDIVALLATGKTPPDATIAVNQPNPPEQTAMQMGESAIVGQAIANPVANRLQRVFGVTQFKISPQFVAGSTLPQARVTLQQQVSSTITFTYSQDLSQANSELVQVEVQLTPRFSAVATRDENGIFGVDFYYKKQFR